MRPRSDILFSVLIASLAHREDRLMRLLGILLPQAEASEAQVEVVAYQNNGSRPIYEYRDTLLSAARGKYLAFVDDDDVVPGYYVEKVVRALGKDPDCVGFIEVCSGLPVLISELSLQHEGAPWEPVMHKGRMAYLREFNHAMPVRSEFAKQVNFQGAGYENTGEDMAYAAKVLPLLRARGRREVFIPEVMYHYIWDAKDTTQSGHRPTGYLAKYADHPRPKIISPCFRWVP